MINLHIWCNQQLLLHFTLSQSRPAPTVYSALLFGVSTAVQKLLARAIQMLIAPHCSALE